MRLRMSAVWVLLFVMFSGCAGVSFKPEPESRLEPWVSSTLILYLKNELSGHPRFKDQKVLLVKMSGDDLLPEIDAFTGHIRGMVMDALMTEPGVRMVWRPAVRPWRHPQSLAELNCGEFARPDVYIGIDTAPIAGREEVMVRIRALDPKQKAWVPGFCQIWRGKIDSSQSRLMTEKKVDEYLRGLRPLPFEKGQPDLLASYLAANLSCLFRQGQADELKVYVKKDFPGKSVYFETVLSLLEKNLAMFREVKIIDTLENATVTVNTEILPISPGLFQVWVTARSLSERILLPGTETSAYVRFDGSMEPVSVQTSAPQPEAPEPQPVQPQTRPPVRPEPQPVQQSPVYAPQPVSIINGFALVTPVDPALCQSEDPWSMGKNMLGTGSTLSHGDCIGAELSLSQPARVVLMGQDGLGRLTRLFPSQCPGLSHKSSMVMPDGVFRFPWGTTYETRALELDQTPGTERVYAIVMTDPFLADEFLRRISNIKGLCRPGGDVADKGLSLVTSGANEKVNRWKTLLMEFQGKNNASFQWREITFHHAP